VLCHSERGSITISPLVIAKMHRNPHNRDLVSLTVKPGTETGLYYILIANVRDFTHLWPTCD
jgi:hypothetical protein